MTLSTRAVASERGRSSGPRTDMWMEPDEVVATVEPAGLRLLRTVELPPYHYAVSFEKPAT